MHFQFGSIHVLCAKQIRSRRAGCQRHKSEIATTIQKEQLLERISYYLFTPRVVQRTEMG